MNTQKKPMKKQLYYHFTTNTLRDGSPIPKKGKWLRVTGKIVPCDHGLHASAHPFDALRYAPGNMLHLVELGSVIVPHGNPVDKAVSNARRIVASINAESLLREFARTCAMDVIHLWNAPPVVIAYLRTGDDKLREGASRAAWAAAAAAWAEEAAGAAGAAAAASVGVVAGAAARAARADGSVTKSQRDCFQTMVDKAFADAAK